MTKTHFVITSCKYRNSQNVTDKY